MPVFRSEEDVITQSITTYQRSYGVNSDARALARAIVGDLLDYQAKHRAGQTTDSAGRAAVEAAVGTI